MVISCWVTHPLSTQIFKGWETESAEETDMTAWSLIDCAASHYQQNKVLIIMPYINHWRTHLLLMKQILHVVCCLLPHLCTRAFNVGNNWMFLISLWRVPAFTNKDDHWTVTWRWTLRNFAKLPKDDRSIHTSSLTNSNDAFGSNRELRSCSA